MRQEAEVVIVGAGIMGLAIAYNLAKHQGLRDIVVLDQSYLCGGASGRNGGGVRAQWSSEANVRLMQESLRICRDFAREHRINTWFRQGGYLFLVRSDAKAKALAESVKLQNECGLTTRLLEPKQARGVVPELSTDGVVAACYNPDDAVVFPWPFVWGYADGARTRGVEVETFTRVTGIETTGKRVSAVVTDKGTIKTSRVVNAAGALSPEVARLAGITLPNRPHRHEICSSEPLKPWLEPLVADSRSLLRACPILGSVKILRQWAGLYDITPDSNPIVGEIDELSGFFLACGFMGHGFMMAPVIGKLMAEVVAGGAVPEVFERWNLRRFEQGALLSEGMIIG